ncbi:DUF6328 family protein, partial [Streptomyces sp. NPDC000188]
LFGRGAKPEIVQMSSRLAAAGLGVLMLALAGSVLLVVDVTTGRAAGIAAGAGTFAVCAGLWGVLPRLVRRSLTRAQEKTGTPSP